VQVDNPLSAESMVQRVIVSVAITTTTPGE
jgi:hypothetical protein